MVREYTKNSTVISLVLHLVLIAGLLVFSKPISMLIPSRSDGLEVSLVSMPNQTVQPYQPKIKAVPAPIKVMDTPADVNLKQNVKPQPKPTPAEPPKEIQKAVKPIVAAEHSKVVPQSTSKVKTPNKKAQINDLLGDALSTNTTAVRKGKALGGNPNGTSDSNNLIGNYADQVINAVRPFVMVPDDINPKAKATIQVELNPNLSVRKVTLLKSSGNSAYDSYVQQAIQRVKVFPPLPDGARYVDYRILKLTFRPE
jgi:TonB family protein